MNHKSKFIALATAVASVIAGASAQAQNANFANGDLILGFQAKAGTGSDTNVLVNLGNTATVFRNASTNNLNLDNIVNVNAILTATFGANWWDNTNLLFGAAGVWSNVIEATLQNGDPEQSIYMSKARTANAFGFANEDVKNSTLNTPNASSHTGASNNIMALNGAFETQPTASQVAILNTVANTWEDYNVTSGGFVQSTAFTAYTGGIQQRFGAGSYGTFATHGAVEGALDLYRAQGQNDVSGQFDEGGALRVPQFQGILTIDNAGNVDFITSAVPEPSSALLLGAASLIGLAIRRRRTVTA